MTVELCTDSFEGALIAEKFGIKRIELCTALSEGGLTPSYGLIKKCSKLSVEVHVMIRPRGGDFQYTTDEIDIMKRDIESAKNLNASGVVFGVLDNNKISSMNKNLNELAISLGLETTFHRAFDVISDYHKAIEQLIAYNFKRVLTSGLQPTAEQGLELIAELQMCYGDKIQIMAGSGINDRNALKFAKKGIKQIHFTARKPIVWANKYNLGIDYKIDETKIKFITNLFS